MYTIPDVTTEAEARAALDLLVLGYKAVERKTNEDEVNRLAGAPGCPVLVVEITVEERIRFADDHVYVDTHGKEIKLRSYRQYDPNHPLPHTEAGQHH